MLNKKERYQRLARHIRTSAGRQRIANSLKQPLRQRRDYHSVGRKAFLVEDLQPGALPVYDKDPEISAYVIGEEGMNIVNVTKPKRVMFPLFELAANPEIPITVVNEKRFDIVERDIDKGRAAVGSGEDRRVFAVMDAMAADANNPNPVIPVTGNLTSNALIDAIARIQRSDIRVANIFMNARDYADILKFDRDVLDPETQRELLQTGLMARAWGANFITSRMVAEGTVYVCGEPEFFGRMPVRTDLTILSADDPKRRMIGFSMFENLGIGMYNPYALQTISITRS